MIALLTGFVSELRQVGIPVSMVESIDAARVIQHVSLEDREALRHSLAATLIKNERHLEAFDAAFDVFFSLVPPPSGADDVAPAGTVDAAGAGGDGADVTPLITSLLEALAASDMGALRAMARQSVGLLAGVQPGRPVGGRYYLYRVLSRLQADTFPDRLMEQHTEVDGLERTLLIEDYRRRVGRFERMVEDEIRRLLVADRGREAVARTTRTGLLEDIDLAHAPPGRHHPDGTGHPAAGP